VVKDNEREQTRVQECLLALDVKERTVSADAVPSHARTCASIPASDGDSLLCAKGNQSTLKKDLPLFCADPPVDCREGRTAETLDAGHGHMEHRFLMACTELTDLLARDWPAHVMRNEVA
jgi:hypothetical protein